MSVSGALLVLAVVVLVRPWAAPPRAVVPPVRPSPAREPRLGFVAGGPLWGAALAVCLLSVPPAAVAVALHPTAMTWWRRRTVRIERDRGVIRALPDAVDLLVVAIGAGLTARSAIAAAAPWVPEPIGSALGDALARSDRGEALAIALAGSCRPLGDAVLPMVSLLGGDTGDTAGGARLPALIRLGDEARRRRRADAQERARRLPVSMLLPLVVCVLPAFVLIGIVPLLLASVGELGFTP